MPTPVSLTDTSTNPSFGTAPTSIRPPSGVNLIAFDSKFRTTCRIFRSSVPNLANLLIDGRLHCDAPSPSTLANEGQSTLEDRHRPALPVPQPGAAPQPRRS